MTETLKKSATYEDLEDVPDHKIAEIAGGDLYASPRPSPRHARATSILGAVLIDPFDRGRGGPGGWWIFDEPELHIGYDVLVPDLAGWKRDRRHELPETAWFGLKPDWVCEVLSPASQRLDRDLKLPIYASFEVPSLWLIDPLNRTLEVLRLDGGSWVTESTHRGEALVQAEPFEEVAIRLGELWS